MAAAWAVPDDSMKKFSIGPVELGGGAPLAVVAGPCVIESEDHVLRMAAAVADAARQAGLGAIFKASFDKANRTSTRSYRGPGLEEGLRVLAIAKKQSGLPVLTDIHEVHQVGPAAEVCDVLQIPAFLCRQTDLLVEAGRSGRVVNIKKGQFLAPWDIRHAAEKVAAAGEDRIVLTERGSSFGYNNLVVDFRSLAILRETGYPVVLDVTHSLQLPGGGGSVSGGQPQFIEPLSRAGAAFGVDALFFEVHDAPERALSDGANALRLELLGPLLKRLAEIDRLVRPWLAAGG
jgi:2-dehydro-3-deoxyphosphooctonate aldolase (KDO 8-P synthase)